MKHTYLFLLLISFGLMTESHAQNFCDSTGNVIIYSNYDGGPLTINVDQNIPNLKIGIVSYEFDRITITGAYAGNVTQLWWVGYDGSNDHCNLGAPLYTTITGVPNSVDSIIHYPAATYSNANGYSMIICNYSCSTTTNQGGCNTADQIAHYFLTNFGGSLRFHYTQYGCWTGTMNVSAGGNCCANPLTTAVHENPEQDQLQVSPNPSHGNIHVQVPASAAGSTIEVVNVLGELIRSVPVNGASSLELSLEGEADGVYFLRIAGSPSAEKIVIGE